MYTSIMWSRRSPRKKIKTCSIFLVLSSSLFSFHMICLCCILFILPVYYIHDLISYSFQIFVIHEIRKKKKSINKQSKT